jgi:hypothetical protein
VIALSVACLVAGTLLLAVGLVAGSAPALVASAAVALAALVPLALAVARRDRGPGGGADGASEVADDPP